MQPPEGVSIYTIGMLGGRSGKITARLTTGIED
jgi:hypothetical protein